MHVITKVDTGHVWPKHNYKCSCGKFSHHFEEYSNKHARLANLEEIAGLAKELASQQHSKLGDEILELCKEVGRVS